MKRTVLVVVLALALTFVFAGSAFATTGKFFTNSQSYYTWYTTTWDNDNVPNGTNVPAGYTGGDFLAGKTIRPTALFGIGDNPTNPGAHANYLATTAKCGMCHSVHRAAGDGVKLLPTTDATCAGCHTGGTAITAKLVTWTPYDVNWTPVTSDPASMPGTPWWNAANKSARASAITTESKAAAGGAANGGGPHNDSALDLIVDGIWDGNGATPAPDYNGSRYGCFTRRCHATNPHGAGGSKYKIFAAKLLFNESANEDELGDGTYGGEDAIYDDLGATDASVQRFLDTNSIITADADGDLFINGDAPDANETHALVSGLTCGRPSNPTTGEDECHAEAAYAIVDKGIVENRNHATNFTGPNADRTDNTGGEDAGWGGNDHRDSKTGHVAGTFAAVNAAGSYSPIAGCTSCHDQKDFGNTVSGNFTFPHGQVAYGGSNLTTDGVNPLPAQPYDPAKYAYDPTKDAAFNAGANAPRSRIWAGYSGSVGTTLTFTAGTNQKAYDGQCLKCHRSGTNGIGLTH